METVKISQLHRTFLKDLLAYGKAPKTVRTYESHFVLLLKFLGTDDLRALKADNVANFVSFLGSWKGPHTRGAGLTANSVHGYVASLRSFCKWLIRRKHMKEDPTSSLDRIVRPRKLPRAIPSEWAQNLLTTPNTARNRAVILLLRTCALRRSELVNLNLGDVDLPNGVLVIRHGKGGKDRGLPLDTETRRALADWIGRRGAVDGPLFVGCRGQRLGSYGVGQVLSTAAKAAGLPHVTPHQLRHTLATEVANTGTPVTWLQEFLGHESLATTQKYTHVTAQNLRELALRMEQARKIVEQGKPTPGETVNTALPQG